MNNDPYQEYFKVYAFSQKASEPIEGFDDIQVFRPIQNLFHINIELLEEDDSNSIFGDLPVNIGVYCSQNPTNMLIAVKNSIIYYYCRCDNSQDIEKIYLLSSENNIYEILFNPQIDVKKNLSIDLTSHIVSLNKFAHTQCGWHIVPNNSELLNKMLRIVENPVYVIGILGDISNIKGDAEIEYIRDFCKASSSPQIVVYPNCPYFYLYLDLGGVSPMDVNVREIVTYATDLFKEVCGKIIVFGNQNPSIYHQKYPLYGSFSDAVSIMRGSASSFAVVNCEKLSKRIYITGFDHLKRITDFLSTIGFSAKAKPYIDNSSEGPEVNLELKSEEYSEDENTFKIVQYIDLPCDFSNIQITIYQPIETDNGIEMKLKTRTQCVLPDTFQAFAFMSMEGPLLGIYVNSTIFIFDEHLSLKKSFKVSCFIDIAYSYAVDKIFYTCSDGLYCEDYKIDDIKGNLVVDDFGTVIACQNVIIDLTDNTKFKPYYSNDRPIFVHRVSSSLKVAYYESEGCVKASNGAFWKMSEEKNVALRMLSSEQVLINSLNSLEIKFIPQSLKAEKERRLVQSAEEEERKICEEFFEDESIVIKGSEKTESIKDIIFNSDYKSTTKIVARNFLIGGQRILAKRGPSSDFYKEFYSMPHIAVTIAGDALKAAYSIVSLIDVRTDRSVPNLPKRFGLSFLNSVSDSVSVAFGSQSYIGVLFTPTDSEAASAALAASKIFSNVTFIFADDSDQLMERIKFTDFYLNSELFQKIYCDSRINQRNNQSIFIETEDYSMIDISYFLKWADNINEMSDDLDCYSPESNDALAAINIMATLFKII